MRTRIGVDMDGVILDNYSRWADYYNSFKERHNHPSTCLSNPPSWSYYPDLCKICYKHIVNDLSISTPLVYGAKEGLNDLRRYGELWLISHRSPSLTLTGIQLLKENHIFDFFTSFDWSFNPKLETCLKYNISVLIDDSPNNILALQGSPVTPIIFDYKYNRGIKGLRAYNWKDAVHICSNVLSVAA